MNKYSSLLEILTPWVIIYQITFTVSFVIFSIGLQDIAISQNDDGSSPRRKEENLC